MIRRVLEYWQLWIAIGSMIVTGVVGIRIALADSSDALARAKRLDEEQRQIERRMERVEAAVETLKEIRPVLEQVRDELRSRR